MVIYFEYIIFLNILLDFLLLMSISVILTRRVTIKRLVLGSIVGGLSIITLFFNFNNFIIKLVLGLLMVLTSFGYHSFKYTINNLFYLYTLSFIIGGVMYLINDYNYLVLIICFIIVLFLYIKMIKNYQSNYQNYYLVEIIINNSKYLVTGYLDTGNKLYDSFNRPVVIINKKIKYNIEDIIYVPYQTINKDSVLKCIKADEIIINKHIFKNYLVGLSNKKINIDGINCILHSRMKGMI